ncbi:hypothetical protein PN441_16890 [Spirulina major CS-329]|nr:hypothetical protein [Spirulina subsalsa]MDB9504757.1 hypothetical protein [Spirulina major CS-329]
MMSKFAHKTALSLGLLGSLAAVAVAPAAEAQVRVTGGNVSGAAGFFIPDSGNISLFDLAIQNMQIVSPNGVLTNPLFIPTATGGFVDADTSNSVTAGDTGLITGKLSGIAFSAGGSLIPFSQVDTALAYNVGNFTQIGNPIVGSLISANNLPQLFIPTAKTITSSSSEVTITPGVGNGRGMSIGSLNANLTAGLINLPSDVQFRSSSSPVVQTPYSLPRNLKFKFEGSNVTPELGSDLDPTDNEIQFIGEANQAFEIATFGDGNNTSFKLESDSGFIDIALGNVQVNSTSGTGTLTDTAPTNYKIEGQTEGIFALFAPGQVAVQGSGRNTTMEFQQGANGFKANTEGGGDVTLLAAASGVGNGTAISTGFTNYQIDSYRAATRSSQFSAVQNVSEASFVNKFKFGNLTLVFNLTTGRFTDENGSESFVTSSSVSASAAQALIAALLNDVQFVNSSSNVISIFSGASESNFELVAARSFNLKVRSNRSGRVKVKFVQRGGRRIFVALRGDVGVGAFEQVGPGSRMFPGLFGTRQLSEEDAEAVYELIDTLEISDADDVDDDADSDDADDVDDDDDSDDVDDSDDDDEDDDESADADQGELPSAITGLESLSDEEVNAINEQIDSLNPSTEEPAATEPAATEPAADEPAAEEPVADEPAADDTGASLVDDAPVAE